MRHLPILMVLLLLGACGGGARNDSTANAAAPANVAEPAPTATPTATASPSATGWDGTYEAKFDGGTGTVTIAQSADSRYKVALEVGAQGCTGKAEGLAELAGDSLVLTLDSARRDNRVCQIALTRDGDLLEIEERNCLSYHGASCGFVGSAVRQGSQPAAPADAPGNAAQ